MALGHLSMDAARELLRLPRAVTLKHELEVQLEHAQDCHFAEMFSLVRRSSKSTGGFGTTEFTSEKGFIQEVQYAQETGSAVNAIETKTGRIIGLVVTSATTFGRGLVNPYSRGYNIVDPTLHNSGLGKQLAMIYLATSIARGYVGAVARVTSTNKVWLKAGLKVSEGHVIGRIPNNIDVAGEGRADDNIIISDWGRESFYSKMTVDDIVTLAQRRRLRKDVQHLVGPPVHVQLENVLLQDATPVEEDEIYTLLHSAAEAGDMFSVDEFPTKEIFKESFIRGRRLLSLRSMTDGALVGACIVGISLWSRVYENPPNAMFHVYLLPEHRSDSNLSSVIKGLGCFMKSCGFIGVLLEEYACPSTHDELLRAEGYSVIGCLPKWGYMSGRGWADCNLFYKDIQQNSTSRL